MSPRPLIPESEKDKHKTRDQLLKELTELRGQLAAKTDGLAGCNRVIGMLDGITEPILILDDGSQIVYANSAAERLFAKSRELIEGRSLWDVYPKRPETLFYNAYEKAKKNRSTGKFREMHRLLGKWFDVYLYPVPGGMTVLFNDITISRQMEELPRLALILLHNLKDNVFLMRADGRLFHVNNETKNSLGYSSDELHKMSIFDVVPQDCRREWQGILDRIRQHGSMTFESRLCARDGREFPVEVYASYIELYGIHYYTISARDNTERKEAERSSAFLASVVHTAYDAILSITLEGIITSWNYGAEKLYGYTADEALGNDIAMLAPLDRQTEVSEALERMRIKGLPEHYETLRQRKDGTLIDVSLTLSPIVDASGAFVGSSVIVHNISERIRNERALKESEANLSRAQRIAHIGNWTWDTKKDRVYCSDEFYRIFGMPRQDYITYGQFINTLNPEDRDPVNGAVDAALNRGEIYNIDYRIVWPNDNERIVHAEGEVLIDQAGKPATMFGTIQDVTERKKEEKILEKYRLFSENARDIALFIGRDGHILEANRAAVETYGYTREELLSKSIYDLRVGDPGQHVDEQMDMAFNKGILFETVHRRKDGSTFPVEVNSQGRIIDGQKVVLSVVRDIAERKQVEEALQVAKAQAELYVDLMGHDINNMNQIAMGSLEVALMVLEQGGKLDASGKPLLEKSIESLTSSSQLIRNVQKLQRASTEGIGLKAMNVTALLESVIREFQQFPGKALTIDFSRAGDCMVSANELLKDVFVNLIGNAIKHSRTDQSLTIGISADNVVDHGKKYCRFIIEDNGPGIPDDTKEKLFNRFARGATKAHGSGLGLYLVKTLVEHYGGQILVEDRVPGDYCKGARFVVTIPSSD
jgi:PAS domain S-box-containing protein